MTIERDERACSRLIISAAYFADLHKVEDFIALFADDGSVERMGEPFVGVAAIRGFMAARKRERRTRHILSPPLVEFEGPDTGRAVAQFILFEGVEADNQPVLPVALPSTVGEFRQTYRRVDGEWKIVTHSSSATFKHIQDKST